MEGLGIELARKGDDVVGADRHLGAAVALADAIVVEIAPARDRR